MTVAPPLALGDAGLGRDPAARRRLGNALLAVVLLWPLLQLAEFRPAALFEAGNLTVMKGFLAGFMPPARSPEFLGMLLKATLETLAIATAGITLALLLAAPLAVTATRALFVSAIGPGPGRRRGLAMRGACRALLTMLRAIPEIIWALMFVGGCSASGRRPACWRWPSPMAACWQGVCRNPRIHRHAPGTGAAAIRQRPLRCAGLRPDPQRRAGIDPPIRSIAGNARCAPR
jgi:hypothetical protein